MSGVFARLVGQHAVEAELVAAAQAARGDCDSQRLDHRDHDTCVADHRPARFGALGGGAVLRGRAAVHRPTACPGCGECRACTTTMAGTHADVRRVIPEGLSIGVDEMRAIVQIASRRPSTGRWQVVVIEDADRLTEGAANALLKVVEEPPPSTVFLLCAPSVDPEDIAITLRSRCRHVALVTPSDRGHRPGADRHRRAQRRRGAAGRRRSAAATSAGRAGWPPIPRPASAASGRWGWRAMPPRRRARTRPPRSWSPPPRPRPRR